jgi:hypothetical protein
MSSNVGTFIPPFIILITFFVPYDTAGDLQCIAEQSGDSVVLVWLLSLAEKRPHFSSKPDSGMCVCVRTHVL